LGVLKSSCILFSPEGEFSLKVRDIIAHKGDRVVTLTHDRTISDAVLEMAVNKIGAIIVTDFNKRPVGIFTERDFIRKVAVEGCDSQKTKLSEAMTKELIIGLLDDDLDDVGTMMTERRFRHLPIFTDGELRGIISQGDIVKARLAHHEFVTRYLSDYISGKIS